MRTTLKVSSMVFVILLGASVFSLTFRGLGGEHLVSEILNAMPGGAFGAMFVVMALMFVLGFFLDFIEIIFVVVPIVGPILLMMGLDPIWLGVMIAVNLQTSFLTPPFGFALFYLRGVAPGEIATMDIYRDLRRSLAGLGREIFGNRKFVAGALTAILQCGSTIDQQGSSFQIDFHICQLILNRLQSCNRFTV